MEDAALHAARDEHDLPGHVTRELVRGEHDDLPRHVLGLATLRSAIVRVARSTTPVGELARVIVDAVQPGATAFTRARGATRTTSFFSESRKPDASAAFAAA